MFTPTYRTPQEAEAARRKAAALMGGVGDPGIGGAIHSIGAGIMANRINSGLRQQGYGQLAPNPFGLFGPPTNLNPDLPMMGGQGAPAVAPSMGLFGSLKKLFGD